jgi:hypothetical protein
MYVHAELMENGHRVPNNLVGEVRRELATTTLKLLSLLLLPVQTMSKIFKAQKEWLMPIALPVG